MQDSFFTQGVLLGMQLSLSQTAAYCNLKDFSLVFVVIVVELNNFFPYISNICAQEKRKWRETINQTSKHLIKHDSQRRREDFTSFQVRQEPSYRCPPNILPIQEGKDCHGASSSITLICKFGASMFFSSPILTKSFKVCVVST